jgi:GDP-6-deoxy-D-talose 4-dehydrogenase
MLEGARVLVTGLNSFTGRYLEPLLMSHGAAVHGVISPTAPGAPLDGFKAKFHKADLLDLPALHTAVQAIEPTHVVHLAAISFVAHDDVDAIYRTNVVGTRNLLAALHAKAAQSLQGVILASSANIYGNSDADPIAITTPPRPANDYAVSKLAMEHVASLWAQRLPITIVRPFNYTGVGQSPNFLVPKIVQAYQQRAASLELGNLDVARDFCDVRDVADAYVRLLATSTDHATPQAAANPSRLRVVNTCSGVAVSLNEILAMAQQRSGHKLEVRVNPAFVRADEVKRLRGDPSDLHRALGRLGGWVPRPFSQTVAWMVDGVPA